MNEPHSTVVAKVSTLPEGELVEFKVRNTKVEARFKTRADFADVLCHFSDMKDLHLRREPEEQVYVLSFEPHNSQRVALRLPVQLHKELVSQLAAAGVEPTWFFLNAFADFKDVVAAEVAHRVEVLKLPLAQRRTNVGKTKALWVSLTREQVVSFDTAAREITRGNRSHLATLLLTHALKTAEALLKH